MKNWSNYSALAILLATALSASAQSTISFSQYMFNGLLINPGYAGVGQSPAVNAFHRRQWVGVDGAPVTQGFTANTFLARKKIGAALVLMQDKIGIHENLGVTAGAAYRLRVSEGTFLSFGMNAGFTRARSDFASTGSTDPNVPRTSFSTTRPQAGAGVYFHSPTLRLGFSMPQLLTSAVQFSDSARVRFMRSPLFLFSAYRIRLSESVEAEPGILLRRIAGVPLSLDINTCFIFREVLTTGLGYRKGEAMAFLLKAKVTPRLEVGYGYEHLVGAVSAFATASHEVMARYAFVYSSRNLRTPR